MDIGSDFLFARPSFLEGVARTLDLGGTLSEYNRSLTPAQADYIAIWSDWRVVGNDIRAAVAALKRDAPDAP
jgi:hypothetical protein